MLLLGTEARSCVRFALVDSDGRFASTSPRKSRIRNRLCSCSQWRTHEQLAHQRKFPLAMPQSEPHAHGPVETDCCSTADIQRDINVRRERMVGGVGHCSSDVWILSAFAARYVSLYAATSFIILTLASSSRFVNSTATARWLGKMGSRTCHDDLAAVFFFHSQRERLPSPVKGHASLPHVLVEGQLTS